MFKNKNSQSMEKQASSVSPATRRLLQDSEEFTFAGSSSGCQDAIKEMGYQPADMDADDMPDLPVPDKYKACEGFLETVLYACISQPHSYNPPVCVLLYLQ